MPGGPEAYVATHVSGWITVWSSAAVVAANFMGDALLVNDSHSSSILYVFELIKEPF